MSEKDSAFLKTSLTMSRPNLDASIEAAEEENEKILRHIVDPAPGFVIDDIFTDADLAAAQNENEAKFQLGNAAQKRLDTILDELNKSITFENESSIQFEKEIADDRKDFAVQKSNENLEVLKSTSQTKIDTVKRKNVKRSPYQLHSRKRQFADSSDALLHRAYLYLSIPDNEANKIKAAESVIDSIFTQLQTYQKTS